MIKKILIQLDDIFALSDAKRVLIRGVMDTKTFWRIYFWWGIRQARKRRKANEIRLRSMPKLTNDEYWESVRRKSNVIT